MTQDNIHNMQDGDFILLDVMALVAEYDNDIGTHDVGIRVHAGIGGDGQRTYKVWKESMPEAPTHGEWVSIRYAQQHMMDLVYGKPKPVAELIDEICDVLDADAPGTFQALRAIVDREKRALRNDV